MCFSSMYSVSNTLSEHIYFYMSKNITSTLFWLVIKIVENLQCTLKDKINFYLTLHSLFLVQVIGFPLIYTHFLTIIKVQNTFLERACFLASSYLLSSSLTWHLANLTSIARRSQRKMFLGKDVLKIYNKFTREHPCRSVISLKLF